MSAIAVHRTGTGPRRGFFAHCSLSSGKSLMSLMGHFEDEMSMTAIDLPGQGKSAMPDMNRDYHTQCVQACLAEIEASGVCQDLFGHSFGATVMLRLAALRPDLVRSLVLFEPVYFGLLKDANPEKFDASQMQDESYNVAVQQGDMLAAAKAFLGRWGLPGEWDAMSQSARQAIADRMWQIPAQHDGIIPDNEIRMRLDTVRSITCPALIIHGQKSPAIMSAITETISSAMPAGQGEVLPGAGHMGPITHAPECAARMRKFWGL